MMSLLEFNILTIQNIGFSGSNVIKLHALIIFLHSNFMNWRINSNLIIILKIDYKSIDKISTFETMQINHNVTQIVSGNWFDCKCYSNFLKHDV
jgi:hypothetical protein